MRVLFLHRQPCIRTLKYGVALRNHGGVDLAYAYQGRTLSGFYGSGDELFDAWYPVGLDPRDGIAAAVDDFRPDVIHSHNLPDVLTVIARDVVGDSVGIVHDVHDFQSLRNTPYDDGFPDILDPEGAERAAVEGSDALVTVGQVLMDEISDRYRVPDESLIIPNLALERDLPSADVILRPRSPGPLRIAYQGTLSIGGGHYDLRDIFAAIAGTDDVELHVHPSQPALPEYRSLAERFANVTLYDPMRPEDLLARLPMYDAGWAGFNDSRNAAHLATVLPNKAFEYVGCGLPVLTLPHRALARWVTEEGTGVVLADVGGFADAIRDLDLAGMRRHLVRVRDRFTMEGAAADLVDLYARVGHRVAMPRSDAAAR